MSFRFRRSISIIPGLKLNLGKTGASVSVGPHGAKMTIGKTGVRATAGIPGTGLSFSEKLESESTERAVPSTLTDLASERPEYWEFKFLQTALRTVLDERNARWRTALLEGIDECTFAHWVDVHIHKLSEWLEPLKNNMTVDLQSALGQAGQPADPEALLRIAHKVGEILDGVIAWEEDIRIFRMDIRFREVAESMSGLSKPYLDALNEFQNRLDTQIPVLAETGRIDLAITMGTTPKLDEFKAAFTRFETAITGAQS